ncbi:MAG: NAD(P) transhydrogenase subunit alpha [Myxococcota bacterium]
MIVGVPTETYPGERRVAIVPNALSLFEKLGVEVCIEAGAGSRAGFPDEDYAARGATTGLSRAEVFERADVVAQVRGFGANPEEGRADLERFRSGQVLVSTLDPLGNPQGANELAKTGVVSFALELLPRISRAQSMDVLSSMATVAGYHATLLAATSTSTMWPLLMTAAGTITPAKVLVVGAGVAGLQAIATARRLGAVVDAYDVRPAAREQVESLGGNFIELELDTGDSEDSGGYAQAMDESFYERQREMMTQIVAAADAVITTAAVPGRAAPVLVTESMVRGMRPGSVLVDLAAETGGNCDATVAGETRDLDGVSVIGPTNVPSAVPADASNMYARNVHSFLANLIEDGNVSLDKDDPIVQETTLTRDGSVTNDRVKELLAGD